MFLIMSAKHLCPLTAAQGSQRNRRSWSCRDYCQWSAGSPPSMDSKHVVRGWKNPRFFSTIQGPQGTWSCKSNLSSRKLKTMKNKCTHHKLHWVSVTRSTASSSKGSQGSSSSSTSCHRIRRLKLSTAQSRPLRPLRPLRPWVGLEPCWHVEDLMP